MTLADFVCPPVIYNAGLPIASAKTGLTRACALAAIEGGVTAYTLRHTWASWLVAEGIPTRKVANFLGTSEGMVLDHYGHLAPDYQEEAAQAIGRGGRVLVGEMVGKKTGGTKNAYKSL